MTNKNVRITDSLQIYGWSIDAILLAALSLELNVLLVGEHGVAKSQLVRKLSRELNASYSVYNAATFNLEDIVGIPIPVETEEGVQLEYVYNEHSIWQSQFVLMDEISRATPQKQNRTLLILQEKMVLGMKLEKLRWCWAAMNPSSNDDEFLSDIDFNQTNEYIGTEQLDIALLDRFPFIIQVPTWQDFDFNTRKNIIFPEPIEQDNRLNLIQLITQCKNAIPQVLETYQEQIVHYVIACMELLNQKANLYQTPRRSQMMANALIGIHAARLILNDGDDIDFETSCHQMLTHCIPQLASLSPKTKLKLLAIHRQAYFLSQFPSSAFSILSMETNPAKRIKLALDIQLSYSDLGPLVTQAIEEQGDDEISRLAIAIALYYRIHQLPLPPYTLETVKTVAEPVFKPDKITIQKNRINNSILAEINQLLRQSENDWKWAMVKRNFLLILLDRKLLSMNQHVHEASMTLDKFMQFVGVNRSLK